MPRYHLHVRNGFGFAEDEEGQEFADLDNAKEAAVAGARSLLREEITRGEIDLRGRIEITDEAGKLLSTIAFEDQVRIVTGPLPESDKDRG